MNKTISVTDNFRIMVESNQYTVQQLHMVDPRNSPKYNPDKHGVNPEIRPVWKDEGYYGLNDSGLQAAIKSIIFKESGLSGEEEVNLREYLDEIKEISDRVFREVDGIFNK